MSDKLPVFNVNDTKCVHCKTPIVKRLTMADGRGALPSKGMIMVCSNCLHPMILGDTSWRPLEAKDFKRLPPESRKKLILVAKGIEGLLKSGGEWSPYDQKPLG